MVLDWILTVPDDVPNAAPHVLINLIGGYFSLETPSWTTLALF